MVCHFNYSEATEYRDKGELASQRYFDSVLAMEKQVLESVDRVIYVSNWAQHVVEEERDIHPARFIGNLEWRQWPRATHQADSHGYRACNR